MTSVASSADAGEQQLLIANAPGRGRLTCFILAVSALVVRAAGVEPAQRLRTEGF